MGVEMRLKLDTKKANLLYISKLASKSAQNWSRTSTPKNGHKALNLACLPIPPPGRWDGKNRLFRKGETKIIDRKTGASSGSNQMG